MLSTMIYSLCFRLIDAGVSMCESKCGIAQFSALHAQLRKRMNLKKLNQLMWNIWSDISFTWFCYAGQRIIVTLLYFFLTISILSFRIVYFFTPYTLKDKELFKPICIMGYSTVGYASERNVSYSQFRRYYSYNCYSSYRLFSPSKNIMLILVCMHK
jgi:hypothetical protein